jgi:hypothetical protein
VLPLKTRDIMKSVIIAIAAALLFADIFLPLFLALLLKAMLAINETWITDSHARALLIIYGTEVAAVISYTVSGFLMSVLICFVSKSNRMLTTILALLLASIIYIICLLAIISYFPQDIKSSVLIRSSLRLLLDMVFFWGCAFLGVWFMSRRKRKTGQQSLPGDNLKAEPQP